MKTGAQTLALGTGTLSSGAQTLYAGTASLADGASSLSSGTGTLASGAKTLAAGSASAADGADELSDGLSELNSGTTELSDGTQTLQTETDQAMTTVADKLSGLLGSSDSDEGTPSFTSSKNGNVDSVQFVIKTEEIKVPETKTVSTEQTAELNVWQKLLKLFGVNV